MRRTFSRIGLLLVVFVTVISYGVPADPAGATTHDGHIGVYRGGRWFVDLNDSGAWDGCAVDWCGTFGAPTDLPVVTHDGHIGAYRGGRWFVDLNDSGAWDGCAVDWCGTFGAPTDLPVVTHDGHIGAYRGGRWFVDLNDSGAWDGCAVDWCGTFGAPTDLPVVTHDGHIGAYRGGRWFVDLNDSGAWDGCAVDWCGTFGAPTDLPVVTHDGHIGAYRGGRWFVDLNDSGAWDGCAVDWCGTFGAPTDLPVIAAQPPSLDPSLPANFGEASLTPGFLPDPAVFQITSGGPVDANPAVGGVGVGDCRGFVTAAPDLELLFNGPSALLRFYFLAATGGDTALIINAPDGSWWCSDDSFATLNPTIDFGPAAAGIYDIWVGSYVAGENHGGELHVTELDGNHP